MGATYTYSGDPTGIPKDAVRFFTGDTGPTDWFVSDQEINFVLSREGAPEAAAATVCEQIAAQYSRRPDRRVGDLQISSSQIALAFAQRAIDLRSRVALGAVPFAGGLSISGKAVFEQDTDLVRPAIRRGMTGNPQAGPIDSSGLRGG